MERSRAGTWISPGGFTRSSWDSRSSRRARFPSGAASAANTSTWFVQVPPQRKGEMPFLNHNGIDVHTEEEVDECHRLVVRDAEKWQLKKDNEAGGATRHVWFLFL